MGDPIIYEPRGRALEYAALACNLWIGCAHRCGYCYGPAQFRVDPAAWGTPRLKRRALERLDRDAALFTDDPREILFSFSTDPYGTEEQRTLMYDVLDIAARHRLHITVLTKNPLGAEQHFERFARHGWRLGTSISFASETLRKEWEPGAPPIIDRVMGLDLAREAGIKTWVSVEPVLDLLEGLAACYAGIKHADETRVGKWNHDARAAAIDWKHFHACAAELLKDHPHIFKRDLLEAAGYREVM